MFALLAPLALMGLSALQTVQAVYPSLYTGCIDTSFTPTTSVTDYNQNSPSECGTYCYLREDGPFTYSYFLAELTRKRGPSTGQCICSNEYPELSKYVNSPNSDGSDTCASNQYAMYTSASTYTFDGCYNGLGQADQDSAYYFPPIAITNPQQCLAACKEYDQAGWLQYQSSQWICGCASGSGFVRGAAVACGPSSSYYLATHEADTAISSQFARRQLKERLIRAEAEKRATCPKPLTACKIAGSPFGGEAFECINVTEELESCGGCAHGAFNSKDTAKFGSGVDCTTLPGVAKGGVTCSSGACVTFACQNGYVLDHGVCIQA